MHGEEVQQQLLLGACMVPVFGPSESDATCAAELVRLWGTMVTEVQGLPQGQALLAAGSRTAGETVLRGRTWVFHMQPFLLDVAAVLQGPATDTAAAPGGAVTSWFAAASQLLAFLAAQKLPSLLQRVRDALSVHAASHCLATHSAPAVSATVTVTGGTFPPAHTAAADPQATTATAPSTSTTSTPSSTCTPLVAQAASDRAPPRSPASTSTTHLTLAPGPEHPAEHDSTPPSPKKSYQVPMHPHPSRHSLRSLMHAAHAALWGIPPSSLSTTAAAPSTGTDASAQPMSEPHYLATKNSWLLAHFDLQLGMPLRLLMPLTMTLVRVLPKRLNGGAVGALKPLWMIHVSSPLCAVQCSC